MASECEHRKAVFWAKMPWARFCSTTRPDTFSIPQETHQALHSVRRPGNRNMSGIRAGTGLPKHIQRSAPNAPKVIDAELLVVSTPYWHTAELLTDDRGILVPSVIPKPSRVQSMTSCRTKTGAKRCARTNTVSAAKWCGQTWLKCMLGASSAHGGPRVSIPGGTHESVFDLLSNEQLLTAHAAMVIKCSS